MSVRLGHQMAVQHREPSNPRVDPPPWAFPAVSARLNGVLCMPRISRIVLVVGE